MTRIPTHARGGVARDPGRDVLLLGTLVVQGRSPPLTRRIDLRLTVVTCILLTWISPGHMFQAAPTNQVVQLASLVVVPVALFSLVT